MRHKCARGDGSRRTGNLKGKDRGEAGKVPGKKLGRSRSKTARKDVRGKRGLGWDEEETSEGRRTG